MPPDPTRTTGHPTQYPEPVVMLHAASRFILSSQDGEDGGISDRPGDVCDPFHTLFGLAGLSLLGDRSLAPIDPVLCMPAETLRRRGVRPQTLTL